MKEELYYGYKAFNKGLTNIHNKKFEVGKAYTVSKEYEGYFYHYTPILEDVYVYYSGPDIEICKVVGFGETIKYYNEYYDVSVYASEKIYIESILTRQEIIEYILQNKYNINRVCNFIARSKLSSDEINLFYKEFQQDAMVLKYIDYYCFGNKNAFSKKKTK